MKSEESTSQRTGVAGETQVIVWERGRLARNERAARTKRFAI
ncbi:MAG: hypothetical protein ACRD9S_03600 [Pyrinomonadaceae bacterium]